MIIKIIPFHQEIHTLEIKNRIGSGCYILSQNTPVSRLGNTDPKGILYIGKGNNLLRRVNSLQRSVRDNCNNNDTEVIRGHKSLGKKVHRIQKHLNLELLTIKLLAPENMEDVRYLESYLLESYVQEYGELPPLNGQFGSFTLKDSKEYLIKKKINLNELIKFILFVV